MYIWLLDRSQYQTRRRRGSLIPETSGHAVQKIDFGLTGVDTLRFTATPIRSLPKSTMSGNLTSLNIAHDECTNELIKRKGRMRELQIDYNYIKNIVCRESCHNNNGSIHHGANIFLNTIQDEIRTVSDSIVNAETFLEELNKKIDEEHAPANNRLQEQQQRESADKPKQELRFKLPLSMDVIDELCLRVETPPMTNQQLRELPLYAAQKLIKAYWKETTRSFCEQIENYTDPTEKMIHALMVLAMEVY